MSASKIKCPQCGGTAPFRVHGMHCLISRWVPGADEGVDPGTWDDSWTCKCHTCGHTGIVKDFRPDEEADWLTNTLDCGDNSCLFKPLGAGGMRTNGGCQCFADLDGERRRFVWKMAWTIKILRTQVADLEQELTALKGT